MDTPPESGKDDNYRLNWTNVAFASLFVLIDSIISLILNLGVAKSLVIAATRCVVQLTIMGFILQDVFATRNPWAIMGMTFLLVLLGTIEVVYNKSNKRYGGMFLTVLTTMGSSTIIVGILGTRFAMRKVPFWDPQQFIPIMGMLLGNAISGMVVGIGYILSHLTENKDKVETKLAYGASRWEAGGEIAREGVRLAILPTINQMSVIGLISIPGMMTGVIIGGAPVEQAVKYQQIIMFMLSASTVLGVLAATVITISICIDECHRLRPERIYSNKKGENMLTHTYTSILDTSKALYSVITSCCTRRKKGKGTDAERRPLLANTEQ